MHGSSANMRPRQRTSTSCTECRRRKQKCNQAKDRPCNNCARRYPPVVCSYEGYSSRSSAVDKIVDLDEVEEGGPESSRADETQTPAYQATTQSGSDDIPTTSDYQVYNSSHPFYSPLATTTSYRQRDGYEDSQHVVPSSSASGYYSGSTNYQTGYAYTSSQSYDTDYYTATDPQEGQWLSSNGDPGAFIGSGTAYDTLSDLPIDQSRRNADLFYFFHQTLAPYYVTINGKDQPASFYKEWTPWIVQSPLMANLTILAASSYQSEVRGLDVAKCPETIAIQVKIISLVNKYLEKQKDKEIHYDAMAAIMYLATNEWYWGDDASCWAHMRGLKEMLKLRGGIVKVPPDSLFYRQLILTDYQICCSFEQDLFLHKDTRDALLLTSYPASLESPLLPSSIRFIDRCPTLDLNRSAAEILDDMKFLTTSIRNLRTTSPTAQDIAKFHATALWTHDRIKSLPMIPTPSSTPEADLIYESVRLTALMFSTAIHTLTPLSQCSTIPQLQDLASKMWRVSLSRWKELPGILLWIVLVACPASAGKTVGELRLQGKFLKMMIGTAAMCIAVQSQDVAVACLKSFLGVQRWIDESAASGNVHEEGTGSGSSAGEEASRGEMLVLARRGKVKEL